MNTRTTKALFLLAASALTIMPGAKADQWNQKTLLTFSGPVEIPGQILPAGTYIFKVANSSSSRNIVQVFNKDQDHVFGTFLTILDYRRHPSDKTIIRFEERAAGSPQAIKAWFYPGRNYGHEFVYPKKEAIELAKANKTAVPAMPTELAAHTTEPDASLKGPHVMALMIAPLKAEKPTGEEVEVAEAFNSPSVPALPDKLPATASPLPTIGLIGLLALITAAGLRIATPRTS